MLKGSFTLILFIASLLLNAQEKMSYTLREAWQRSANDSLTVSVSFRKPDPSLPNFSNRGIMKISRHQLAALLNDSNLIFISPVYPAKEELTTGAYDLTLNTVNFARAQYPSLQGNSLRATIKERRFDTTDIDLKGRIFRTGTEAPNETAHASLMATMIAGAANSSPFAQGIAPAAQLSSASFLNLFPENDLLFQQYGISVENHSYGTVPENFYGNEARAYDLQANAIPTLLHVFSSGNSGDATNTAGPYAGIAAFANLTGNFKHSKNSIAVGSVDSSGQLMPLSSRGPAHDGRVKPELMAYGEDGSSGAAATVSGTALLLQEAYRVQHNSLPPSSLVKAALLNSANDIGVPRVDYSSGYGNLNAYRALSTIMQNRYREGSISNGGSVNFSIAVPGNLSQLKIMLVWNDPAAAANASKALVNDLDLELHLPATSQTWLPWVLDPSSSLAALQAPAVRKKDTLNTAEQVTIDNPVGGDYLIEVKASLVNGSQSFSIVYQLDTAQQFYWTYPTGADPLIAGNTHFLRWQTNRAEAGQIEYATNGGNWRIVGSVQDLRAGQFRWQLPDTITTAVLRLLIPADGTLVLSDSFTISPQPDLQVGFNCADSFLLYWNAYPSSQYRVYELGDRYLNAFAQQADSSVLLSKSQHPSLYYAVGPVIDGKEGIRSNTLNYLAAGPDCYIRSFFLQSQDAHSAGFFAELGSLFRVSQLILQRLGPSGFEDRQSLAPAAGLSFQFTDTAMHQGENHYRLKLVLSNGTIVYSNTELLYHFPADPVIFYPNPVARGRAINIITNESGRYQLEIFDARGRRLFSQLLTSTRTEFSSTSLATGIYFMRVSDSKGKSFGRKVIVN